MYNNYGMLKTDTNRGNTSHIRNCFTGKGRDGIFAAWSSLTSTLPRHDIYIWERTTWGYNPKEEE